MSGQANLQALVDAKDIDAVVRFLQLVVKGGVPEVSPENEEVITVLTKSSDVATRFWAKKALGKLADSLPEPKIPEETAPVTSTDLLLQKLNAVESTFVSLDTIKLLCESKDPQVLQPLIDYLSRCTDEVQISYLTKQLGQAFPSDGVLKVLVPYLKHPDARVVANTIEGIECIQSPSVVVLLSQMLAHDHHRVRANAVKAIGNQNRESALLVLGKMLEMSDKPHFVIAACHAAKELKTLELLETMKSLESDQIVGDEISSAIACIENSAQNLVGLPCSEISAEENPCELPSIPAKASPTLKKRILSCIWSCTVTSVVGILTTVLVCHGLYSYGLPAVKRFFVSSNEKTIDDTKISESSTKQDETVPDTAVVTQEVPSETSGSQTVTGGNSVVFDSQMSLGVSSLESGNPSEALEFFERAGEISSASPKLYCNLAACHQLLGNNSKRTGTLEEGFSKFPDNWELMVGLVTAYVDQQEVLRAIELVKAFHKKNPTVGGDHLAMGICLSGKKEFQTAIREFKKELNNTSDKDIVAAAHFGIGKCQLQLGMLAEASATLQLLQTINKNQADKLMALLNPSVNSPPATSPPNLSPDEIASEALNKMREAQSDIRRESGKINQVLEKLMKNVDKLAESIVTHSMSNGQITREQAERACKLLNELPNSFFESHENEIIDVLTSMILTMKRLGQDFDKLDGYTDVQKNEFFDSLTGQWIIIDFSVVNIVENAVFAGYTMQLIQERSNKKKIVSEIDVSKDLAVLFDKKDCATFLCKIGKASLSLFEQNLCLEFSEAFILDVIGRAVKKGKLDIAQRLIDKGHNPTPALLECRNRKSFELLLSNGAKVNYQHHSEGGTPLIVTAAHPNYDCIQILLQYGADPNLCANDGKTPLMFACMDSSNDSFRIVKSLLDAGARVNDATHSGMTAICYASAYGDIKVVRLLMQAGADPNVFVPYYGATLIDYLKSSQANPNWIAERVSCLQSRDLSTSHETEKPQGNDLKKSTADPALAKAVIEGDITSVKEMLASGANPNSRVGNATMLLLATSQAGSKKDYPLQIIKALVESGADPNPSYDYQGEKIDYGVAFNSVLSDREDIVGYLLGKGCNFRGLVNGKPLWWLTIERKAEKQLELFLKQGFDPNEEFPVGRGKCSALLYALGYPCSRTVRVLLKAGAKPPVFKEGNIVGFTTFNIELAKNNGKPVEDLYEVLEVFLQNGFDVNSHCVQSGENSPIFSAIRNSDMKLLRLLVDYKANLNLQVVVKGKSQCPLSYAGRKREIVEFLLSHGADANTKLVRDGKEMTLTDLAVANKAQDIVELYKKHGAR